MTQTEKLYYYLDKINSDPILKEEVYKICDPQLFYPAELEEQLSWLWKADASRIICLFRLPMMAQAECM